jgi:mono/diheme cytochrome c family protein
MPDGQLYATITNGLRNMPAYRAQIPVADRWAIVAYVRALQLAELENPSPPAENEQ